MTDLVNRGSGASMSPDSLEVAPGSERANLQGWVPELAGEQELREALEKAFDFRGDVTLTLKDGRAVEGYVFDRRSGAGLADSQVRLFTAAGEKTAVAYSDIAALAFTGRDTAAGKSWEAWVRQYWKKRAAGEHGIGIAPEPLE